MIRKRGGKVTVTNERIIQPGMVAYHHRRISETMVASHQGCTQREGAVRKKEHL